MEKSGGVFLSLGSNLGNRQLNLNQANNLIGEKAGTIKKKSAVYETAPWGKPDQPHFLNQVVELHTSLSDQELLSVIRQIEKQLGRERNQKWDARTIDIDILYFRDQVVHEKDLTIPHPLLAKRKFVLVPLTEISPEFVHPVVKKSNAVLLQECEDNLNIIHFTN